MSKKINKFDALAYAVAVLGQPHEVSEDRAIEESHGLVADKHWWALPKERRWLAVHEWSDGDQTIGTGAYRRTRMIGVRNNDDGSLCPEYEEQARWMIDAL